MLLAPSAANRMILARWANPARIDDERAFIFYQPFLIPGSQCQGGYRNAYLSPPMTARVHWWTYVPGALGCPVGPYRSNRAGPSSELLGS